MRGKFYIMQTKEQLKVIIFKKIARDFLAVANNWSVANIILSLQK